SSRGRRKKKKKSSFCYYGEITHNRKNMLPARQNKIDLDKLTEEEKKNFPYVWQIANGKR
ncbi:24264_t:CDS:2, partial [Gigaspora rosea]